MVWVHFLFFIKMSILQFSLILKFFLKAISKELMFMQVTADPVSIIQ